MASITPTRSLARPDPDLLYRKSMKALQRMSAHEERTGVQHDKVMIFPHGAFSEAALAGLKHTQFIAAACSEIISTDPDPQTITGGRRMGYGGHVLQSLPHLLSPFPLR